MAKKFEIRNSTAEFLIFQLEGKEDGIQVVYKDETIWATQKAIAELKAQKRNAFWGLDALYKGYFESGQWVVDETSMMYDEDTPIPNANESIFTLPFPTEDVVFNENLMKDPIEVDVRSEFSY